MATKIRAKYANGVLTPLDPLELEEGAMVVIDIKPAPTQDSYGTELHSAMSDIQEELERICQLPDGDPKKYKLLLDAEDVYIYLDREIRYMERNGSQPNPNVPERPWKSE